MLKSQLPRVLISLTAAFAVLISNKYWILKTMLRIERKMDSVRVSERFVEELQNVCDRRGSLTHSHRSKNSKINSQPPNSPSAHQG